MFTLALLPSWQLTYDPQTWDQRNASLGMLVKYRRDFAPWNARLILGADADLSPGSFEARQAVTRRVSRHVCTNVMVEVLSPTTARTGIATVRSPSSMRSR